ncbi:MAG: M48 family metallopeptidase [Leptospiraceae bacterium]|nr:M48 family metallopeptidase [Leptospiraceae bacterium]
MKDKPKVYNIVYGETNISFSLIQSQRKTLEISVLPDMSVEVKAPVKAQLDEIKKRVYKRGYWILKRQQEFETYLPSQPVRKYISGETHRYLGKQYRLKILKGTEPQVKLIRGFLQVYVPDKKDSKLIKELLEDWFSEHAKSILKNRFDECRKKIKFKLPKQPELVLRNMKTRWGSCTKDGRIILNPKLIHASTSCIDYVIIHELCHLIEHNHSKKFYELISKAIPNWRERQKKLNQILV